VDFSNPVVWADGTPVNYQCGSCGYIANVFPDVKKDDLSGLKKEISQKPQEKSKIVDVKTGTAIFYFEMLILTIDSVVVAMTVSYLIGIVVLIVGCLLMILLRRKTKNI